MSKENSSGSSKGEIRESHQGFLSGFLNAFGIDSSGDRNIAESLPWGPNDTTGGSESELQASVIGRSENVDLPLYIQDSKFYANLLKRSLTGETPKRILSELEDYICKNKEHIWDNSWVRLPLTQLNPFSEKILSRDLLVDKSDPSKGLRSDAKQFIFESEGRGYLRVPLSYLIKLSLADVLGQVEKMPDSAFQTSLKLLGHFANDNTSPETHSLYITALFPSNGNGKALAQETGKRFLLTQLLVLYANKKFDLEDSGQRAVIFQSPRPPIRQKILNNYIPDSFYRELFMSPCLSGWDRGEDKYKYMGLCHEVLSRSQLNTLSKLREAGIITRNLMVLPNLSNISLANNGTHVSIGSLKLANAIKNPSSGFTPRHEKYFGDLSIKIFEHFLPLFVAKYTAAPHRMEFADFHPELALGFLPHELHFSHLRMIWRRWTKKAKLKIFGKPVTPFGPIWLDKWINNLFGFKGDYMPDYRLNDYLVSLLSTETSSSLDGSPENEERLKKELMHMGVFDSRMSLYLLYKLREYSRIGFSGFEGRHYSLFHNFSQDMAQAVNLQILITFFSYKLISKGIISHKTIPDSPFMESERRQIIFGTGLNIPTFFVKTDTNNLFLKKILKHTKNLRLSNRYKGFVRVHNLEYQKALLDILKKEAADCIEILGMEETIRDLEDRICNPDEFSAFGKLSKNILAEAGVKSPYQLSGTEFNLAAERYYRNALRKEQFSEGLEYLKAGFDKQLNREELMTSEEKKFLQSIMQDSPINQFIQKSREDLLNETASLDVILKMICLLLIDVSIETKRSRNLLNNSSKEENDAAPVY